MGVPPPQDKQKPRLARPDNAGRKQRTGAVGAGWQVCGAVSTRVHANGGDGAFEEPSSLDPDGHGGTGAGSHSCRLPSGLGARSTAGVSGPAVHAALGGRLRPGSNADRAPGGKGEALTPRLPVTGLQITDLVRFVNPRQRSGGCAIMASRPILVAPDLIRGPAVLPQALRQPPNLDPGSSPG